MKTILIFLSISIISSISNVALGLNATTVGHICYNSASDTTQYATLYVYRNKKMSGSLAKATIYMGNNEISKQNIGKIKSGGSFVVKLYHEGKTSFVIEGSPKKGADLDVKFGKSYYLRVQTQNILGVIRGIVEFVDEDTGRREFEKLQN
ncbi:MAG: hypothetical protein QM727_12520 [Niabella sp.]